MESINLAKPPETPENPEILYIHQDFVINALNTDPLPHKKSLDLKIFLIYHIITLF